MGGVPVLQGLRRGRGAEGLLGQVVFVQRHVAVRGLFEVAPRAEVVRMPQVGDAAVGPLDHAVGLGAPGSRQAGSIPSAAHSRSNTCCPLRVRSPAVTKRSVN